MNEASFYIMSSFTWDQKWTQTGLKSRSVYMAISLWQRTIDSLYLINVIKKGYQL